MIGACVGQGNQRFFLALLVLTSCGMAVLLVADLVWLVEIPLSSASSFSGWQPYIGLFFLLLFTYTLALASFAAFHCSLLLTNRTTRELFGKREKARTRSAQETSADVIARAQQGVREVCCAPIRCLPVEAWPTSRRTAAEVRSSREAGQAGPQATPAAPPPASSSAAHSTVLEWVV